MRDPKENVNHLDEHLLCQNENGKILTGGKVIKLQGRCENGWVIEPTVIEGLNNKSRLNQEEVLGIFKKHQFPNRC